MRGSPTTHRYDFVRYYKAQAAYAALTEDQRFGALPRSAPNVYAIPDGHCPRCGFPPGQPGFVRLDFPIAHPLFGKMICCPRCWPPPWGESETAELPAHYYSELPRS